MGRIGRAFTAIALAALRLYRATLSYAFGPCCRFHPSCSAYAEEALRVHGALRGSWLAVGRLLRCNPLCAGGLDPVPPARRRVARAIEPAGTRAGG